MLVPSHQIRERGDAREAGERPPLEKLPQNDREREVETQDEDASDPQRVQSLKT